MSLYIIIIKGYFFHFKINTYHLQ